MSNKKSRTQKEMENLFADPKFARKAWKAIGNAILQNPAVKPIGEFDKNGDETLGSKIEKYSYLTLSEDLKTLGTEARQPTELEMIIQCQIAKARYDTAAAVFVRDTLGAKPVDESKVDANISNPYENLTDEELELLAKHRAEKAENADKEPALTENTNDDGV